MVDRAFSHSTAKHRPIGCGIWSWRSTFRPACNWSTPARAVGSMRGERARDVLRSILDRVEMRNVRVSILAFYSESRPVVIDAVDPDVVANILADLPLEHAFSAGKTNLYAGIKNAAEIGKQWRPKSAVLVVVSDGDTLPAQQPPVLPAAFGDCLILGVGNDRRGTYIDGHTSRQDVAELKRLAVQLHANYYDANARHVHVGGLAGLEWSGPGNASRARIAAGMGAGGDRQRRRESWRCSRRRYCWRDGAQRLRPQWSKAYDWKLGQPDRREMIVMRKVFLLAWFAAPVAFLAWQQGPGEALETRDRAGQWIRKAAIAAERESWPQAEACYAKALDGLATAPLVERQTVQFERARRGFAPEKCLKGKKSWPRC